MKIVHIITRLILGGAQENTLLSCEGQHDRGHDVTLITGPAIGPEGSLIERARRSAIASLSWTQCAERFRRRRIFRPIDD